jgi:hypothetical protein
MRQVQIFIRHCEERSLDGNESEQSQRRLCYELATKQSSFTQLSLREVFIQFRNHFTAN